MRKESAKKNMLSSFMLQIVTIVCGFLIPRFILKQYGSNINGLVSSITQFLSYISLLEAGFGPVVKAVLYKPIAKNDKKKIVGILKYSELLFRRISYIFIGYIVVLCFLFPLFVNNSFNALFTISLLFIIAISIFTEYYFGMTYSLYLQAEQKTYIVSLIQVIAIILNSTLTIILILNDVSIHIVKLCSTLILTIRPLLLIYYVKKHSGLEFDKNIKPVVIKQKWDGLAQHIASVIHGNTDIALLTIFSTLSEVSVYSIYMLIINGIKNLVFSLRSGIDAIFGDMIAKNQKEVLKESFRLYELFFYSFITIIFAATYSLIIPFVSIFTDGITDANYIRNTFAIIIITAELFDCIRWPYSSLIIGGGFFKETRVGAWVESISNLTISLILINKLGIIGVAIGTLVAMFIRTIEFIVFSSKKILERNSFIGIKRIPLILIELTLCYIVNQQIVTYMMPQNYGSWIVLAIVVTIISSIIVLIINAVLYFDDFKKLFNFLKKRGNE